MRPDYKEALRLNNSRLVLRAIAEEGGIARFSTISKKTGLKGSVLRYHLKRLEDLGVIEMEVKGVYRLRYKCPLCFIFESNVPYAYLGLLGRKEGRRESETEVAMSLLRKEGIKPILNYVFTSIEALNEWRDIKVPVQWILCKNDEIIDIDLMKSKVRPQLEALLRDYVVIVDCTSATKPATIAFYDLAQEYLTPLIYIYEERRKLIWLISRERIKRELELS